MIDETLVLSSCVTWRSAWMRLFLAKNKLQNFLIAYVCLVAGRGLGTALVAAAFERLPVFR